MRRNRYSFAANLNGFIADPDGGYDWIPEEPPIVLNRYRIVNDENEEEGVA